jgi:hypothetical protein
MNRRWLIWLGVRALAVGTVVFTAAEQRAAACNNYVCGVCQIGGEPLLCCARIESGGWDWCEIDWDGES